MGDRETKPFVASSWACSRGLLNRIMLPSSSFSLPFSSSSLCGKGGGRLEVCVVGVRVRVVQLEAVTSHTEVLERERGAE